VKIAETIAAKRDGQELTTAQISDWICGLKDNSWADYQSAALLMAITLRGMNARETADLTRAMADSGERLRWDGGNLQIVDKHSTGGVGDKVSLILAPLVASCGPKVPMISGRGLGHTGGTLDKLESIPEFRTDLSVAQFQAQVVREGLAIIGQTRSLAPADRRLYALRDVTATVESIPLICASILSKKLAAGLGALVMDVKCGSGAFMKDLPSARALAQALADTGKVLGLPVRAILSAMDEPLGETVGNAPEVVEAIQTLQGEGPPDMLEVAYALGVEMLLAAGQTKSPAEARLSLERALHTGAAFESFGRMLHAQGGDEQVLKNPAKLLNAPHTREVRVPPEASGYVTAVDALEVGRAACLLGAGRQRAEDAVDSAAGLSRLVKRGTHVTAGQLLAVLHTSKAATLDSAEKLLRAAIRIAPEPPNPAPLILDSY
jgi:pyrimidine-nucleoside phosphorylase